MRERIKRPISYVPLVILMICATNATYIQAQTPNITVPKANFFGGCLYMKVFPGENLLPQIPKEFEQASTIIKRPHLSEAALEGASRSFQQFVSITEVRHSTGESLPFRPTQRDQAYQLVCGTFGGFGDAGQQ